MENFHYIIIGGGIAGTNAAETIRKHDSQSSILLITSESERLYSRVQLPHFLRGTIGIDQVYLKKPDFYTTNQITFKNETTVAKIDTSNRVVQTQKGEQFNYEKLLLATGNSLKPWNVPGSDLQGVYYLRTIEQAKSLKEALQTSKKGVVIGGGFIALDFINTFLKIGIETTSLVLEPYFFKKFLNQEVASLVTKILNENGVKLMVNQETKEVLGEGKVERVITKAGTTLETDIVGVGVGVAPDLSYLAGTSIEKDRFIKTNQFLETNVTGVWAAGDVANFFDPALGRYHSLGNWANAAEQGRLAGLNMAGIKTEIISSSTYSINFLNSSLAIIGDVAAEKSDLQIMRGSVDAGSCGTIYLKDNVIIGASLVGLPQDRGAVTTLIKNKVKITNPDELKDLSFTLMELAS